MTNEEKAQEIKAKDVCCVWNDGCPNVYNAAMEMAEWKEQQMIEKACEWLKNNADGYMVISEGGDGYMHSSLINDFKKAMEEQL